MGYSFAYCKSGCKKKSKELKYLFSVDVKGFTETEDIKVGTT